MQELQFIRTTLKKLFLFFFFFLVQTTQRKSFTILLAHNDERNYRQYLRLLEVHLSATSCLFTNFSKHRVKGGQTETRAANTARANYRR